MSLPSLKQLAAERGIIVSRASERELEDLLAEAMRRDLPLAVSYVHDKAHESLRTRAEVRGQEDPGSPLGKQLTRMFAGTILRDIARKRFAHGVELAFLNCCSPIFGPEQPPRPKLMALQIELQDGTLASADC
jgi:hypothetical protein